MNKDLKKVLEEPIFLGYSDSVKKTRNLLLILSVISLFLIFGELKINSSSTLLGLKFDGLNTNIIYIGLLVLISFSSINFIWSSIDSFQEWQVRQSGTKKFNKSYNDIMYTDMDNSYLSPNDPRNSTLYYWWSTQAKKSSDINISINDILKNNEEIFKILNSGSDNEKNTYRFKFHDNFDKIDKIQKSFHILENAFNSEQIEQSLSKFDARFKTLLISQNLRWIILEFLIPIILSLVSIVFISLEIIKYN